jgi:hypothetical protein
MEPGLEAGVDREGELGLEGFVRKDYLGNEAKTGFPFSRE